MNLELYQELTGSTVPATQTAKVKAVIRRVNALAENLLGYSPVKQRTFTELGTSSGLPINLDHLGEAEEVDGEYISIPYRYKDIFFNILPATEVYAIKLGVPVNSTEFVSVKTLQNYTLQSNGNLITAIQKPLGVYWSDIVQTYFVEPNMNVQLFVAGDFACGKGLPIDLQYALVDMVDYYRTPGVSVAGNVKSESINGHSYTRSDAQAPERTPETRSIFMKYSIKNQNPVV